MPGSLVPERAASTTAALEQDENVEPTSDKVPVVDRGSADPIRAALELIPTDPRLAYDRLTKALAEDMTAAPAHRANGYLQLMHLLQEFGGSRRQAEELAYKAYLEQPELLEALQKLYTITSLNERKPESLTWLRRLLQQRGYLFDPREVYDPQQFMEVLGKRSPEAGRYDVRWYRLGVLYRMLGLSARAQVKFEEIVNRAIDTHGFYAKSLQQLSRLHALRGDLAMARKYEARAAEVEPLGLPLGQPERPSVVFLTIDALQAKHLGTYGYPRKTTPNLDAFAAKGLVFERALATSTATVSSSVSFLTGSYLATEGQQSGCSLLGDEHRTMAEHFQDLGYVTTAILNNSNYAACSGFQQGFDHVELGFENARDQVAATIARLVNPELRLPFFFWVHLIDPHSPYDPPGDRQHRFSVAPLVPDRQLTLEPEDGDDDSLPAHTILLRSIYDGVHRKLYYYLNAYDAELRYTDNILGLLLRFLDTLSNVIVVVSADHGESLGEHDVPFTHGNQLYQELLHVPLILRAPGLKPGRHRSTTVSLVDVLPTLLRLVGAEGADLDGEDLLTQWRTGRRQHPVFAYSHHPEHGMISRVAVDERYKYLELIDPRDTPRKEFFDLRGDPEEYQNIYLDDDPHMKMLAEKMAAFLKEHPRKASATTDRSLKGLDPFTRERLKNLGYLK
ncbi:MAG: hypothetical protein A2284_02755 [Deltaproteobacteria bacterium RIFOXYA12_FULL_61_11]|nr:MAG: hypothetical protein A2284_02755 [Deltaproteobacteria bacterium RIFOXYA12_FULL_61_11]